MTEQHSNIEVRAPLRVGQSTRGLSRTHSAPSAKRRNLSGKVILPVFFGQLTSGRAHSRPAAWRAHLTGCGANVTDRRGLAAPRTLKGSILLGGYLYRANAGGEHGLSATGL